MPCSASFVPASVEAGGVGSIVQETCPSRLHAQHSLPLSHCVCGGGKKGLSSKTILLPTSVSSHYSSPLKAGYVIHKSTSFQLPLFRPGALASEKQRRQAVFQIKSLLDRSRGAFVNIEAVAHARVPLVKCVDSKRRALPPPTLIIDNGAVPSLPHRPHLLVAFVSLST